MVLAAIATVQETTNTPLIVYSLSHKARPLRDVTHAVRYEGIPGLPDAQIWSHILQSYQRLKCCVTPFPARCLKHLVRGVHCLVIIN